MMNVPRDSRSHRILTVRYLNEGGKGYFCESWIVKSPFYSSWNVILVIVWAMIFDNNYLWNENRVLNSPWTEEVKCHKMMKEKMDLIWNFWSRPASVLEEDGAEPQLVNKELGFLFIEPRTRSGRMVPGHRKKQFFGCSS